MALADVFQMILAQQAAEERKEARSQDMALQLLNMEMQESRLDMQGRRYEDALVGQYGGENLIEDPFCMLINQCFIYYIDIIFF